MAMAKFTVDTANKLFVAKSGVTSFDVKTDLYSDAKEHWLTDGTAIKHELPIRPVGGDPIGGGQFAGDLYFLRNGWQIRPDEADHQLLVAGNLFHDDGLDVFVATLSGFTVSIISERSNLVIVTAGLSDTVDGSVTGTAVLKRVNALARGKITKAGDDYTYYDEDGNPLYTVRDSITERTPV